jgi:hypothetical protein
LLDGGPVRLLVDDVLVTVGAGAVLRLGPDECSRLIVLGGGRGPLWLSFGPEPHDTEGERVSAPAALGPCAAPIVWDSCPTCWGQRRIFEVVYAANGEGGLLLPRSRPGCLGIGEVTRAGSREVR